MCFILLMKFVNVLPVTSNFSDIQNLGMLQVKHPMVQYLALVLLETCVKNCEKAFSEVAAERVLDEMVRLIDDPQTVVNNRNKALTMIEAWGESGDELRYLPVYEETYKVL
jgi:VHS domain